MRHCLQRGTPLWAAYQFERWLTGFALFLPRNVLLDPRPRDGGSKEQYPSRDKGISSSAQINQHWRGYSKFGKEIDQCEDVSVRSWCFRQRCLSS